MISESFRGESEAKSSMPKQRKRKNTDQHASMGHTVATGQSAGCDQWCYVGQFCFFFRPCFSFVEFQIEAQILSRKVFPAVEKQLYFLSKVSGLLF